MPNRTNKLVTLWQMSCRVRNIELLAPAKELQSAVDAVDCGADAVYIGAAQFGARHAATNSVEDIAKAVEEIFGVTVEKVTTVRVQGKIKRMGATSGKRPDYKKAIVKLTEGSKTIEFFDGMMA